MKRRTFLAMLGLAPAAAVIPAAAAKAALASGGVVTAATGLVGEAAAETILPLARFDTITAGILRGPDCVIDLTNGWMTFGNFRVVEADPDEAEV